MGERMEWRPIETAPKDGRRIVVLTRRGASLARWSTLEWQSGEWVGADFPMDYERENAPTRWMPSIERDEPHE